MVLGIMENILLGELKKKEAIDEKGLSSRVKRNNDNGF